MFQSLLSRAPSPGSSSRPYLPFGDGRKSPRGSPRHLLSEDPVEWLTGVSPRSPSEHGSSFASNKLTVVAAVAFILSSWGLAAISAVGTVKSINKLSKENARHLSHLNHAMEALEDTRHHNKQESALHKRWKKTKMALDHEVRVMEELGSAHVKMYPLPERAPSQLVSDWLQHRQAGLRRQVDERVKYLQNRSATAVIEKYGHGPHRVKFTVGLDHDLRGSFVIELVPLLEMPHSINFFLDSVEAGVWDDTMFLHHERVDHILVSYPVHYSTKESKIMKFHDLGWGNLGFPEYNVKFQHEKYTIGFAGVGPAFYINTLNNTAIHGPGDQEHHLLPEDADPCFGTIVEGQEIFEALYGFGMERTRIEADSSFREDDHSWSRIVSVGILANKRTRR